MQVDLVAHAPVESVGGIGRYIREVYRYLSRQVPVRIVRPISPPLASRFTLLTAFPLGLRDHRPGSIVHFTQIMGCAQMLWHPVRPAVATVHDLGVLVCKEDELLFNRLGRIILDLNLAGLRRVDHYIVHSEHTGYGLTSQLGIPRERISVVATSVDTDHFHPIREARDLVVREYGIQLNDGAFNLLYVGSELPRKNLRSLLEAMAILKLRGRCVRLLKVGDAGGARWRQRFIEDMEALDVQNEVVIVGVVSEADLPFLYNAADVCVTPTLLEGGFAWLVMEAMACARPVIASSAALVPKKAQDAVLIVPPRDPERLAQTIQQCMDDDYLRRRMAEGGWEFVQSFQWGKEAAAVLEIYKSVLNRLDSKSIIQPK